MDSKVFESETQDNRREKQIIEACGLIPIPHSTLHDAVDDFSNPFEIKSVTKNKGVSTARQVHKQKVNKWRRLYWIFAKGPVNSSGMLIEELYLLHPEDLESFFKCCDDKIDQKMGKCSRVLEIAKPFVSQEEYEDALKVIEVGSRLDDPTIPFSLIRSKGVLLPNDCPYIAKEILSKFVKNRPLYCFEQSDILIDFN